VSQTRILQGRPISDQEVEQIRTLIAEHPQAHRLMSPGFESTFGLSSVLLKG
jgi:hypothetical protein